MRVLPSGAVRSRPWVALLLDCSREFCKAVVGYTDALCVGVQCDPCFHCKKKPGALENRPFEYARAMRAVNLERIGWAVSAFPRNAVQICPPAS
jgi:hypothetical protein